MNKELKDKWVKALRSGDYEQGRGQLRDKDNRFCCLGVLCEVAGVRYHPAEGGYPGTELDDSTQDVLIGMNDSEGASFPQIADYIEENL